MNTQEVVEKVLREPRDEATHWIETYEFQETLSMTEIATEHLRQAIGHYYNRDYVVAITLAGAADEVFGRIAKRTKGENAVDRYLSYRCKILELVGHDTRPTVKEIKADLNWVRNELKHNDAGVDLSLKRYYGSAAIKLIDAALLNVIVLNDFQTPQDPILAHYHKHSLSWKGNLPRK